MHACVHVHRMPQSAVWPAPAAKVIAADRKPQLTATYLTFRFALYSYTLCKVVRNTMR